MNKPTNIKFPPKLVLTAVLSGGLTIGLSLIYILLSLAAIIFRYNCEAGSVTNSSGAVYFWKTILSLYILNNSCDEALTIDGVTQSYTVLVLVAITLAVSALCLVTAITLISMVQSDAQLEYFKVVVYTYIVSCLVSLGADLATASHFGQDYSHTTSLLSKPNAGSSDNYQIEVIRQGAFWIMTIALKGYVPLIINIVFLILLVVYLREYEKNIDTDKHPIHTLGVLNAFDHPRKPEDNWSQSEIYPNSAFSRGPHSNSAFVEDISPPRSPRRPDPSQSDYYSNRSFDVSNSWHHLKNNPAQTSRPFSYLEEIKRPVTLKPQLSPSVDSGWRRDPPAPPAESQWHREPTAPVPGIDTPWRRDPPAPAVEASRRRDAPTSPADTPWRRDQWSQPQSPLVPAPDYSPQPRRLKSALKPAYL